MKVSLIHRIHILEFLSVRRWQAAPSIISAATWDNGDPTAIVYKNLY